MATWRTFIFLIFVLMIVPLISTPLVAADTTWYVNDGDTTGDVFTTAAGSDTNGDGSDSSPYRTITKAMNQATAGDTVKADVGTYGETVSITVNDLSLIGADSSTNGTVLNFGDSTSSTAANGIYADTLSGLLLKKFRVESSYHGIRTLNVDNSLIENVTTIQNGNSGISLVGGSDSNTLKNVESVQNTGDGIFINSTSFNNDLLSAVARNNGGIAYNVLGDTNDLKNNLAKNNSLQGFVLAGESNFLKNSFSKENGDYGIEITSDTNIAEGNKITGSSLDGFYVSGDSNVLRGNLVINNGSDGFDINGISNVISKNRSDSNDINGFRVTTSDNKLLNDTSTNNLDDGFHIGGDNNLIRGGLAKSNDVRGVDLTTASFNEVRNVKAISNGSRGFMVDGGPDNKFINNLVKNNNRGIQFSGTERNIVKGNKVISNDGNGILLTEDAVLDASNDNYFIQNEIKNNGKYGVRLNKDNRDTFTKNIILGSSSHPDSAVFNNNGSGDNFKFTRNWWGTTDRSLISQKIHGSNTDNVYFNPFRLGKVDTGISADTVAPDTTDIVSIEAGDETVAIKWNEVTLNEDGSSVGDFKHYRVYRDSRPLLTDWKDSSTLIATVSNSSDTDYIDTSLLNGETYFYRVTAVDDPGVDGGDGTADYENESFFSDTSGAMPENNGPIWFVNDHFDGSEVFTTAEGSDTNTGSSYEPFATITKAMNQTSVGDTVKIDAGTYVEQVNIDTSGLSIVGADSTPNGTVLDYGDSTSGTGAVGFNIPDNALNSLLISNLRIRSYYEGIEWVNVDNSRIESVTTKHIGQHGFYLRNGFGSSDTNVLVNNVSKSNGSDGFHLKGFNSGLIKNNVATKNGSYGFLFDNADGNSVRSNRSENNSDHGFYVWSGSGQNSLTLNKSLNNRRSGFFVDGSDNHRFLYNISQGNGAHGLEFNGSSNTVIEANRVANNDTYQVYLSSTTSADTFSKNNFKPSNTNPDSIVLVSEFNSDTFDFKRNYWDTTDELAIEKRIDGGAGDTIIYTPYRLDKIGTSVGADTIAPADVLSDTIVAESASIKVQWNQVNQNEDGSSNSDFKEYRVYRTTSGMESDWKNNSSVVATKSTSGETTFVDNNVLSSKTYYYRVTAVDNASLENESFFSDTLSASPTGGSIIINSPSDGEDTRISPIDMSGEASSVSNGDSVDIRVDGSVIDTTFVQSDSSWLATNVDLSGAPGTRSVIVSMYNGSLSTSVVDSAAISVFYDTELPSLPNLIKPQQSEDTSVQPIPFDWTNSSDSFTGLRNYRIQVATDTGFTSISVDETLVSSDTTQFLASDTVYYWRVYARDAVGNTSGYTPTDTFIVDRTAPGTSTLLTPTDNASTRLEVISFDWSDATDTLAGIQNYSFQVATSMSFDTEAILADTNSLISGNNLSLSADTFYYWRVLVRDQAGNTSGFSTANTFTVDRSVDTPVLGSPEDGAATNTVDLLLDWSTVSDTLSGIKNYSIQLDTGGMVDSSDGLVFEGNTVPSQKSVILPEENTYAWRVLARDNAANTSGFTQTDTFLFDRTAPDSVSLLAPLNGTSTTSITINFDWTESTDTFSGVQNYQIQIDTGISITTGDGLVTQIDTNVSEITEILPAGDTYTWRVTARDNAENTAAYSAENIFKINSYEGPVWYVNDNSLSGDVFTSRTGDDSTGVGSSSSPFRTISKAMQNVSTGDTIKADVGTYSETVVISVDNLALIGADSSASGSVIDVGDSSSQSIDAISADTKTSLSIKDFRIMDAGDGLDFFNVNSTKIRRLTITQSKRGIVFDRSDADTFVNNVSSNLSGAGFFISKGSKHYMKNNLSLDNNDGFKIDAISQSEFIGNKAKNGGGYGFRIDTATRNTFIADTAIGNTLDGLRVTVGGDTNTFIDMYMEGNSSDGLVILGRNNTIRSSLSENNLADGFYVQGDTALVTNNISRNNDARGFAVLGNIGRFESDTASNNTSDGFEVTGDSNVLTKLKADSNSLVGIQITGGWYNEIKSSQSLNNNVGFRVDNGEQNTFIDDTAKNNTEHGLMAEDFGKNNTFVGNLSEANKNGIWIGAPANIFRSNIVLANNQEGFTLRGGDASLIESNYIAKNSGDGMLLTDDASLVKSDNNRMVQNDFIDNEGWAINLDLTFNNTFVKNNIKTSSSNPDSGVLNSESDTFNFERNYWNTTNLSKINQLMINTSNGAIKKIPFRLGTVDTGVGADTVAPASPISDSAISLGADTIDVRWPEVTQDEDGSALNFGASGEYRVYRTKFDTVTDWKSNATLIHTSTAGDPTDTGFVDSGLNKGDTYYYRITAVDDATPENESFFSDTMSAVPAHQGPTWYVNDNSTVNDVFTTSTGSDTENTGGPNDPFRTISNAMKKVSPGDTVKVDVGTYGETVTIPVDSLALVGADSSATGTVLDYGDSSFTTGAGILADTKQNLFIADMRISNNYDGILFRNVSLSTIRDVTTNNNGNHGIRLSQKSDTNFISAVSSYSNILMGIYLKQSDGNTLTESVSYDNSDYGINLESAHKNIISNNTTKNNGNSVSGINLDFSNKNIIKMNTCKNENFCINITQSSNKNKIINNTGKASEDGLTISSSSNNIIKDNSMTGHVSRGVVVRSLSHNNLIQGNLSRDNGSYGFFITNSSGNRFVNNFSGGNATSGSSNAEFGISSSDTNFVVQNEIRTDSNIWGMIIENNSFSDSITKNNILSASNSDSGLKNSTGKNHKITRNYWNITDVSAISTKVSDTVNSFNPYRLGKIDTSVGADTIAPADLVSDTIVSGTGSIEVRWQEVTQNEDGTVNSDFSQYRVYRTTSGTETDWKSNASIVATKSTSGDTSFVDNSVLSAKKYYYRITAVDNASPENESFFSDTLSASPVGGSIIINSPANSEDTRVSPIEMRGSASGAASGDSVEIQVDGTVVDTTSVQADSSWLATNVDLSGSPGFRVLDVSLYNGSLGTSIVDSASISVFYDTELPSVPTLVSPFSGEDTKVQSMDFEWGASSDSFSGVKDYRIQVETDTTFTTPADTISANTTTNILVPSDTVVFWRVLARDKAGNTSGFSPTDTFVVDITAPGTAALQTPADGSATRAQPVNFDWSSAGDTLAGVQDYRIQVDTGMTFESGDLVVDSTSISSNASLELSDTFHSWRVSVRDQAGNTSAFSPANSFGVDRTAPDSVSLLNPNDGSSTNTPTINFDWTASNDTQSGLKDYRIQVDTGAFVDAGDGLVKESDTVASDVTITLAEEDTHVWRVFARDQAGNTSGYTSVNTFKTDRTDPDTVALVEPVDGAETNVQDIQFDWTESSDTLAGVKDFHIQIDNGSSVTKFDGLIFEGDTPASQVNFQLFSDSIYSWRVFARDNATNTSGYSGTDTFVVDTTAPDTVALLNPANGSSTTSTTINFDWTDSTDTLAKILDYRIQVATDTAFTAIEADSLTTISNQTLNLSPGSNYFWRVRARDRALNTSIFSPSDTFEIQSTATGSTVAITSPKSGHDTNVSSIAVGGTVSTNRQAGDSLTVAVNGGGTVSTVVQSDSTWQADSMSLQGLGDTVVARLYQSGISSSIVDQDTITVNYDPTVPKDTFALQSPANGAATRFQPVSFDWEDAVDTGTGIQGYRIQVATDTGFAIGDIVEDTLTANSEYTSSQLASDTVYYWRVLASDKASNTSGYTPADTFIVDRTDPDTISLLYPKNGTSTNAQGVSFDWTNSGDTLAGVQGYRLQVAKDLTFNNIVADTFQTYPDTSVIFTTLNQDTDYYWRAFARDFADNTSGYTPTDTFIIDRTDPDTVDLLEPADRTETNAQIIQFDWTDSSDTLPGVHPAENYHIQVDTGQVVDSSDGLVFEGDTTTSDTIFAFPNDDTYVWRVFARDEATNTSGYSKTDTFIIDTTAPDTTELIIPNNGTETNVFTQEFNWIDSNDTLAGVADYYIQVDTGSVVNQTDGLVFEGDTVSSDTFLTIIKDDTYSWRVLVRDEAMNTSGYTPSDTFIIDKTAPDTGALLQPINGASTTSLTINFDWTASSDTLSGLSIYRIQVDTGSGVTSSDGLVFNGNTETSDTRLSFSERTNYAWRVLAEDDAENTSGYSSEDTFVIESASAGGGTMAITSPVDGEDTRVSPINVSGTVGQTVDVGDSLAVTVNGGGTTSTSVLGDSTWTASVMLQGMGDSIVARLYQSGLGSSIVDQDTITVNYDPTAPKDTFSLLVPQSGAETNAELVSFDWQDAIDTATGIQNYRLQVATDTGFAVGDVVVDTVLTSSNDTIANLTADTVYYWRGWARDSAGNTSGYTQTDTFIVDRTAPQASSQVKPQNGIETNSFVIPFEWTTSTDTFSGLSNYRIQVATDTDFVNTVADSVVSAPDTSVLFDTLSEDTVYYWHIRSQDNAINTSGYSPTDTFIVDRTDPGTASLLQPENGAATGANTVSFDWTDSVDTIGTIQEYRIQISTDSTFTSIVIDSPIQNSDTGLTLDQETTYHWRVLARDAATNTSGYSPADTFLIDRTGPDTVAFDRLVDGDTVFYTETVKAITSDTLSGIGEVRFWVSSVGGTLVRSDTVGSDGWTAEWNTVNFSEGVQNLIIESLDRARNSDTVAINVTVDNSGSHGFEFRVSILMDHINSGRTQKLIQWVLKNHIKRKNQPSS